MSNQNMQFGDANEQRSYSEQPQPEYNPTPSNTDTREQTQRQETPPTEGYAGPGYAGSQQTYGAKLRPNAQPMRRRRRGRGWRRALVVILILALLIGIAIPFTGLTAFRIGFTSHQLSQNFTVGTNAKLVIDDHAGNIHIHTGAVGQVQVRATVEHGLFSSDPTVNMTNPDQNDVNVNVSGNGVQFPGSSSVNFDVTVPDTINLDLHTNAGDVDIHDITGTINLQTNAGNITATNTHLMGDANLQTNAGNVSFDGAIDPTASYHFHTNAGNVDVTLPGASAFNLTASTNVGNIDAGFPINISGSGTGKQASGSIGTGPQAQLQLETNVGDIHIHKSS